MIQIPIFWRIMSGYVLLVLLFVGASCYSVIQLGALSRTAHTALDTDHRMISYEEKLTDAFMSEARYAGQFLINHTASLHEQFRQFNTDFASYLTELKALAGADDGRARLRRIEALHERYEELFAQEVRYVNAGQRYAESRFQVEREKLFEGTLLELEGLKHQLRVNLHQKLQGMERVASNARSIAAVMMMVLFGMGVALSFFISKSITVPLLNLKRTVLGSRAKACAGTPDPCRIPEIKELSDALLLEYSKIREAAAANAAFVESVAAHFTTPLISINKRIAYIRDVLNPTLPAQQLLTFKVLHDETERMIERCAQLRLFPQPPFETAVGGPASDGPDVEIRQPRRFRLLTSARKCLARVGAGLKRTNGLGTRRHAIFQTARWLASAKERDDE